MTTLVECGREQDVRDALASGRWPDRCDEDLRAHVAACDVCQDTVVVVAALMGAWDETWTEIRVP
ncbi:MAG TPA: hypothetical protein VLD67_08710, partial [Vicinamibacterales bacterium]|nr:hypothetical protein [Vicinamibacterales bacterium]